MLRLIWSGIIHLFVLEKKARKKLHIPDAPNVDAAENMTTTEGVAAEGDDIPKFDLGI